MEPVGRASLHNEALSDLCIRDGRIGDRPLASGWHSWSDVLSLAAELWRTGEADSARVTLKAGNVTVREFLRQRFGIVTGAREYWHRPQWTPDRADLHEFLGVLRSMRRT
jgi:hypothetical protein